MLILSFVCPFMLYIIFPLDYGPLSVFSAVLIIRFYSNGFIYFDPLYYPLFCFYMWVPYVYIGYQFRKQVAGQIEDPKGFRERILVATVIAIIAVLLPPLLVGGFVSEDHLNIYLPLPIVSVLAMKQRHEHISGIDDEPW